MKLTQNDRFQGGALAPDDSKFEKPETGSLQGLTAFAHFGRKLQKVFPLPLNSPEPEHVGILLRKIEAKLDNPPVPGDR